MRTGSVRWLAFVVSVAACAAAVRAQDELGPSGARSKRLRKESESVAKIVPPLKTLPQQEDATLRAISFVGGRTGYVAGDAGSLWKTEDGGATWNIVPTPTRANLRSLCFLTDRVGWIAGVDGEPYTQRLYGVLYVTRDGGQSWEAIAATALPALTHIQFFDLENGIAVGEPNDAFPTGILTTQDGGRTWSEAPGPPQSGWRAGRFLSPSIGVVVGRRGKLALLGGGRLVAPRIDSLGHRTLHATTLDQDQGWLVGDGALLLRTTNGGVVWRDPPETLPDELRDFVDFHAVAARGRRVWVAGNPGSAIWRSDDAGERWRHSATGNTAPLFSLHFSNDREGLAVGALGTILRTADGGATWEAVLGAGRRAAMVSIQAWPGRIPFEALAKQSAELGHRAVVLSPIRRDLGPDGERQKEFDLRLEVAVNRVGGSFGEVGWRFPLAIAGLETNSDRLLEDWNRRTEGRLGEVFLGSLVAVLRTWRPSVVLIDQPAPDDTTSQILNDAVTRAIEHAADPTRYLAQLRWAGLSPWKVERVYARLPTGSQGQVHVDPYEFLPRTAKMAADLAGPSLKIVAPTARAANSRLAFRLLNMDASSDGPTPRDFFAGLAIAADSDARRRVLALEHQDQRQLDLAEQRRIFQAYVERFADDPRQGAQLISQLRDVTRHMSDEQAALQLSSLAAEYRRRARFDLAEATLVDLVERFPDEPPAREAMVWLFHRWTGAEPAWQRARATKADMQRLKSDPDRISTRIAKVAAQVAAGDPALRDVTTLDHAPDPLEFQRIEGAPQIGPGQSWRVGAVQHWLDQAMRMASLIRVKDPSLYLTPEVQFPLAALMRQRGIDRSADAVYRRQQQSTDANLWRQVAEAELWMAQPITQPSRPLHPCGWASTRPTLDGVFSDDCWTTAKEIRLRPALEQGDEEEYALVMLARDAEHLYVAASLPRRAGAPDDRPTKSGRGHDADVSRHDRLSLYLDVDRDYATWYRFQIDQRGLTEEACWEDSSWNPKWYVAVDADDSHWRLEAAIPFLELTAAPPTRDQVWAVGIIRTAPAVGVEGWTAPVTSQPRPEGFGLLKFDALR